MKHMLVVAGSRALADDYEASNWSRAHIFDAVEKLGQGDLVLVAGGGRAATIARGAAMDLGITLVEFRPDGSRWDKGHYKGKRWHTGTDSLEGSLGALTRNTAVARAVRTARMDRWTASALILEIPWSSGDELRDLVRRLEGCCDPLKRESWDAPPSDAAIHRAHEAGSIGKELVFLDTETGGFNEKTDALIEVAFSRTDSKGETILESWDTKIAVEKGFQITPRAAMVNGYKPNLWAGAPSMREVLIELTRKLPHSFQLVGHGIALDQRFLTAAFKRHQIPLPGWTPRPIDTNVFARRVLLKCGAVLDTRLVTICDYYGIDRRGAHSAGVDVACTIEVFRRLMRGDRQWAVSEQTTFPGME
jgi:DNA polymerase III epsilon subunit-like protein